MSTANEPDKFGWTLADIELVPGDGWMATVKDSDGFEHLVNTPDDVVQYVMDTLGPDIDLQSELETFVDLHKDVMPKKLVEACVRELHLKL